VNVGSRAPAWPLFYMALREGGATAMNGRRPRSGRVSDQADLEIRSRSGDPVWGEITSLTDTNIFLVLAVGNFVYGT
jgi:hypothetical protein